MCVRVINYYKQTKARGEKLEIFLTTSITTSLPLQCTPNCWLALLLFNTNRSRWHKNCKGMIWPRYFRSGLNPCSELLLTTMWGPWQLRGEVLHLLLLLVGLGSNRATIRQLCLCGPQGSQFCLIYEKIRSTVFQVVKLCQLMSNATVNDAYVYHYRMRPDPRGFQSCRNSGPKHAEACQLL